MDCQGPSGQRGIIKYFNLAVEAVYIAVYNSSDGSQTELLLSCLGHASVLLGCNDLS